MKRTIGLVLAIASLATSLAVAAPAPAASGQTGEYAPAQALCFDGQIRVTSPTMSPSTDTTLHPDGTLVIGHSQWVA